MKNICPHCNCATLVIKNGFYRGKSRFRAKVQRYHCRRCQKKFSDQTSHLTYRERKPHINQMLFRLHVSGVSERRCARIFGTTRKTVARKIQRLGYFAALEIRAANRKAPVGTVVAFDEMETFEHTKMKPVSIPICVHKRTRRIIAIGAASMPAKGLLAEKSRKKYGPRRDDRRGCIRALLREVEAACPNLTILESDECPRYPRLVSERFSGIVHNRFKGRRGCVVGQGELKAVGFDPLFALNHTCAMVRDNLKTMSRRTWCTSKKIDRLSARLHLYACYHNQILLDPKCSPTVTTNPMNGASY